MGIGGLSIIYWGYKLPSAFGNMLEAGFRNQFPFDFQPTLLGYINILEKQGYTKGDLITLNADKPGIKMAKDNNNVEIYLDTPLDGNQPSEVEIIFLEQSFKIRFPVKMSEEHKKLLTGILNTINTGKNEDNQNPNIAT